jgi:hypothetical protein
VAIATDTNDLVNPVLMATNRFNVIVKEVNVAPSLPAIAPQTVGELTLLTVTNTAFEPNIHSSVNYQLLNPPAGAVISSNGVISWTPNQTQSPGTNSVTTVATATNGFDLVNPVLASTNTFIVAVKEVNVAPALPVIGVQTTAQWRSLTVTNTAIDPNIHSTVSYALLNPPAGAGIDRNGIFSWAPGQSFAPGTNVIYTVAAAANILDRVNPVLMSTNSFSIVVVEANFAPWWASPPGTKSVSELTLLTVTNTANEPLLHAKVTYTLLNPPSGAVIDANGIISWTPAHSQSPSTNAIFTVATATDIYDLVNPVLTATNRFNVVVKTLKSSRLASGAKWKIHVMPLALKSESFQIEVEGLAGMTYILQASEKLAPAIWKDVQILTPDASPFPMSDTNSSAFPERFYRVRIAP